MVWLASESCVTILWEVGDYKKRRCTIIRNQGDNIEKGASSCESWVTIPGIEDDRLVCNGGTSLEKWVIFQSLDFGSCFVGMGMGGGMISRPLSLEG